MVSLTCVLSAVGSSAIIDILVLGPVGSAFSRVSGAFQPDDLVIVEGPADLVDGAVVDDLASRRRRGGAGQRSCGPATGSLTCLELADSAGSCFCGGAAAPRNGDTLMARIVLPKRRGPAIYLGATVLVGVILVLTVYRSGEGATEAEAKRWASAQLYTLTRAEESLRNELDYKIRAHLNNLPEAVPSLTDPALESLLNSFDDQQIFLRRYDKEGESVYEIPKGSARVPQLLPEDLATSLGWAEEEVNALDSLIELEKPTSARTRGLLRYTVPIWSSDPRPEPRGMLCLWFQSSWMFRQRLQTLLPESYSFALYAERGMEESDVLPSIVYHSADPSLEHSDSPASRAFVQALLDDTKMLEGVDFKYDVSIPRRTGGWRKEVVAWAPVGMVAGKRQLILGMSTPYDVAVEYTQRSFLMQMGLLALGLLLLGVGLHYFQRVRQEAITGELGQGPHSALRRYREVFAENPTAMLVCNEDARVVDCNYSAERWIGFSRQEVLGLVLTDVFEEDSIQPLWESLLREGNLHASDVHLVRQEDKTPRLSEVWGRNIGDHWILMAHDVEKRRDLEQQVARLRRIDSMGALTLTLAHDFNNLLGQVQILVSNLRADVPPGSEMNGGLEAIETKIDDASVLVGSLLTFREGVIADEQVWLEPVLRDFVIHRRRVLPEGISLVFNMRGEMPSVWITPYSLRRVLDNLCVNACDAMPYGGTLTVHCYGRTIAANQATEQLPADQYAVLEISDSGTGMKRDTLDNIFEPFFTTKEKGNGLGLWTVYNVIRRTGGLVVPTSRLGKGSTFTIYLPHRPPKVDGARKRHPGPPQNGQLHDVQDPEDES